MMPICLWEADAPCVTWIVCSARVLSLIRFYVFLVKKAEAECFLALFYEAAMFECERGYIGEIIRGRRKPRTDVSGADIEEIKEKENILLVVLAVKA